MQFSSSFIVLFGIPENAFFGAFGEFGGGGRPETSVFVVLYGIPEIMKTHGNSENSDWGRLQSYIPFNPFDLF